MIGLESFSNHRFIVHVFGPIWILIVIVTTTLLKDANLPC